MTGATFTWLLPPLVSDEDLAEARAYEANSLPGYDVEPPADLRSRILSAIHTVDQLPPIDDDPWRVLACGHLRGELHPQCLKAGVA